MNSDLLECSVKYRQKHILENPVRLKCKCLVCKSCLNESKIKKVFYCNCNKKYDVDDVSVDIIEGEVDENVISANIDQIIEWLKINSFNKIGIE